MKRLLFDIALNDKFTAKMKSIAGFSENSIKKINKSLRETKPLSGNLDQLNHKLNLLEKKRRLSFDTSDMRRISKEILQVQREINKVERKGGMRKSTGMSGLGMLTGAGIGYGAIRLGGDIVETSAKYERFRAVLKNTYQDQGMADKAMSDISAFASRTPFQIDELTDSFVKLTNQGLNPTMNDMTSLGDLAASQGKSFGQLSEAILDATMGEFERLKEFGIKGSTKGNKYNFTFKGQTTEVDKNTQAVKAYILSLGKLQGVQGGMNAISKKSGGMISNLADNWDQLKASIGSATGGPIKDAIGGLSALVGHVKSWFTIPMSQKLQQEKADINALVNSITSYNVTGDQRNMMLNQLQEQYPEFLSNLDKETVSNQELLKRLQAVNGEYEKKIRLATMSDLKTYNQEKLDEQNLKKVRADHLLNLMKVIEKGGPGTDQAINQLNDELTTYEHFKTSGLRDLTGNRWERVKNLLLQQSTEADTELKTLNAYNSVYSAKELYEKGNILLSGMPTRDLSKLSPEEKTKLESLKGDLLYTMGYLQKGILKKGGRGNSTNYGSQAESYMSEIESLFSPTPKLTTTNFGTSGGMGSGIETVAGENTVAKNLIINIDNLMNGDIVVQSTTVSEGSGKIKELILGALLEAVNDVNGG